MYYFLIRDIIMYNAATITEDGSWSAVLDTSGKDTSDMYTMLVRAETRETGEVEEVTLRDVRIGEVWVCSGQSNMQFTVNQVRILSHVTHLV